MNCIKCPILEECPASKMTSDITYSEGVNIPARAEPLNKADCPLLILIAKATKELSET